MTENNFSLKPYHQAAFCEECIGFHNCLEAQDLIKYMWKFAEEEAMDFSKMTPEEYTQYFVQLLDDWNKYHKEEPQLIAYAKKLLTTL